MILGVTGGIASGKSTVTAMLGELGAFTVSADAIAHELTADGQPLTRRILAIFGNAFAQPGNNESLDRKRLGELIFQSDESRETLESVTHPVIMTVMADRVNANLLLHPGQLIAAEIPLLFECRLGSYVDRILTVYCSAQIQIERLMVRNTLSAEEARLRIRAGTSLVEKCKLSHLVISSERPLDAMQNDVNRLYQQLVNEIGDTSCLPSMRIM